jgi:hypothetical protein
MKPMADILHIRTALWACEVADRVLAEFERAFPEDDRPRKAIEAGRKWASGEMTMINARKAAFAAHAAARNAKLSSKPKAEAAARSAAHAAATAHVITHAPHACTYALKACGDPGSEKYWQKSLEPVNDKNS